MHWRNSLVVQHFLCKVYLQSIYICELCSPGTFPEEKFPGKRQCVVAQIPDIWFFWCHSSDPKYLKSVSTQGHDCLTPTPVLLEPKTHFTTDCHILLFSASAKRLHSEKSKAQLGQLLSTLLLNLLFWRNSGLTYLPQSKWNCHLALWLMSWDYHTVNITTLISQEDQLAMDSNS